MRFSRVVTPCSIEIERNVLSHGRAKAIQRRGSATSALHTLPRDGRAGSWERFRKATTMIAVEGNRLHALKIRWTTRNAEEDPDRRAVAGRQLFPKPKRRDRLCLCIDIGRDTSAGNKRAFIVSPMMLLADSEWGKARLISFDSARGSSR